MIIWESEIYELERLKNLSEESLRKLLLPFCSLCVSNNRTDDSKEKDKKNERKSWGRGWLNWRKRLKNLSEEILRRLLLPFCSLCVQSHRWFQGKRQKKLREKLGEGGSWTEEKKREEKNRGGLRQKKLKEKVGEGGSWTEEKKREE